MEKLSFKKNEGIKEYCFEDDENAIIRVNTRDPNLYTRIIKAKKELQRLSDKYQSFDYADEDKAGAMLEEFDSKVKEQINYIFNSDVSSVAFGNFSSVAVYEGEAAFKKFLDAILPEVEKELEKEHEKSQKNVASYVDKAKQFK